MIEFVREVGLGKFLRFLGILRIWFGLGRHSYKLRNMIIIFQTPIYMNMNMKSNHSKKTSILPLFNRYQCGFLNSIAVYLCLLYIRYTRKKIEYILDRYKKNLIQNVLANSL